MKILEDEDILLTISNLLSSISLLFNNDTSLLLADKERILKIVSQEANLDGNYKEGDLLPHDIPAYICMKENKTIAQNISKEYFGIAVKAIATPIKNTEGKIIGSIAIGKRDWGNDINTYAETFVNSFNEISKVVDSVASAIQDVAKSSDDILTEINKTNDDMKKTKP